MNKKILYKLLLIFILLACMLLITNTKSFASDGSSDNTLIINDNTYIMPDWFFTKKYRLFFTTNGYLSGNYGSYRYGAFIACSDTPFSVEAGKETPNVLTSSSEILCYRIAQSGYNKNQDFDFSSVSYGDDCILYYVDYDGNQASYVCTEYYYYDFYSNFDILDNNGNVVFQQPPLEEETPVVEKQETTLAPIVEGMETKKTLAEVVGILPLIIVVVVSLVGLRKALKMLLGVLHRA